MTDSASTATILDETSPLTRKIGYFLGPFLFALTFFFAAPEGMSPEAWKVCGLAAWMACWWITEAMPLPVASLLPMVILPALNISSTRDVMAPYGNPVVFLILGGFVISLAMQKWNLHTRIGLGILKVIGRGEKSVLASMMISTAFMGMWISNTATAIMMLPMAMSMALLLSKKCELDANGNNHCSFTKAMVLGVVYACVIGGLSSFIGSPVNAILIAFIAEHYGKELTLAEWMQFGVPLAALLLALAWALLCALFMRKADIESDVRGKVNHAFDKLGTMTREEKIVCLVFALTASLWVFSAPLEHALGLKLDDPMISIFGALLMFLVPTSMKFESFALNWKDTAKLPWGILVFFGGSMSLSAALTDTGVTSWLSLQLNDLSGLNIVLIVLVVVVLLIAVSELMNNVATITAFLPIMAAMAEAMDVNPLIIMIPATLGASCAFMLPGASAPNALAFGSGYLKVKDMIRTGLLLNIISVAVITLFTFTLVSWAYGIDTDLVPDWAHMNHIATEEPSL